jgi:hypothetical protein
MEARVPELQRIDRNFAVAVSTALRTKSITDGGYVPTPKLTQAEEVLLEEFAGPLSHLRPGFTWSECGRLQAHPGLRRARCRHQVEHRSQAA